MSKETATAMLTNLAPPPSVPAADAGLGSPGLAPGSAPETLKSELDSSRFAQLAKKESELVRQREEFKKERESTLAEKEKLKPIWEKIQQFETLKKTDPVAAIKLLDFTETDLFNFVAAQEDNSTPEERAVKATQSEIQKFKDEQARIQNEASQKQGQEALAKYKANITKVVASDPAKFEYCAYNGALAEELILEYTSEVLKTENVIITPQEAAEAIESFYEEQDKTMMQKISKRKPAAPEPETAPAPAAKAERPMLQPPKQPPKTLSSRTTATVAAAQVPKHETREQKRERLMAKLANFGKG